MQQKLKAIESVMENYLVERSEIVHGAILAILSQTNMLLLGPPGVAKSQLIKYFSKLIIEDGKYFEWLLSKFSTPEELFGNISLKTLEEQDKIVRQTKDKLPEAHIAFIDEIFKANAGILNSMLSILNERVYHNDGIKKVPIISIFGASNEIPEESDGLSAMYDRMVLKFMVQPVQESDNFKKMLLSEEFKEERILTYSDITKMHKAVNNIKMTTESLDVLLAIKQRLDQEGYKATDRTYRLSKKVLQAQAFYCERDTIEKRDFEILQHVLWTDPDTRKKIYPLILDVTNPLKSKIMEFYHDSKELCDNLMAMPETNASEKAKKTSSSVEAIQKIKEMQQKLKALSKEALDKGTSDEEIVKISKKLDKQLHNVFDHFMSLENLT